jgi:hypothetical protein
MKIRSGFVSNSSSSSFIIAVKKNATEEDIKNAFYEMKSSVQSFLNDNGQYLTNIEVDNMDMEDAIEAFIQLCADEVLDYQRKGIELDTWKVSCDEFSNEDSGYDFGMFAYDSMPTVNKDFLKIVSTN